jgi:hypothetical protein
MMMSQRNDHHARVPVTFDASYLLKDVVDEGGITFFFGLAEPISCLWPAVARHKSRGHRRKELI